MSAQQLPAEPPDMDQVVRVATEALIAMESCAHADVHTVEDRARAVLAAGMREWVRGLVAQQDATIYGKLGDEID